MISKVLIVSFAFLVVLFITADAADWKTVLEETSKRYEEDFFMDVENEEPIVKKAHLWVQIDEWGKTWKGLKEKSVDLKRKIEALPEDPETIDERIREIYEEAVETALPDEN
ncbi:uncharacterized protein LOC141851474 [Brevipalpus obovatus]|uniref:uncharacterized protein LOC141851474 n=1 Tax=Brevipalpus obovatus TaxID=246614 RepID=UPI003D9E48FA